VSENLISKDHCWKFSKSVPRQPDNTVRRLSWRLIVD